MSGGTAMIDETPAVGERGLSPRRVRFWLAQHMISTRAKIGYLNSVPPAVRQTPRGLAHGSEVRMPSQSTRPPAVCAQCGLTLLGSKKRPYCDRRCWFASRGDDVTRFWAKVDKDGPLPLHDPSLGPCWVWLGSKGVRDSGHGQFWYGNRRGGAHRFSYELHSGPIPPGMLVRHRCDYPPCVNPGHLLIGTKSDNARDAAERGQLPTGERHSSRTHPERVSRGERHCHAKLTWAQVLEIRQRRAAGASLAELHAIYGIAEGQLSMIARGLAWKEPR